MDLAGKTIALGITGGIAAYKACDLIRELYRRGAERVIPLLTPSAEEFITPLTLNALSRQPVYSSELAVDAQGTPIHIVLAQQADILVILPATANLLAKLAGGIADDLVTTTAITFTDKPVLIAPAMNTRMWRNPLTQRNLETLRALENVCIVEPTEGHLACGETGEGHLADLETILREIDRMTHPQHGLFSGLRALVSAGGTSEPIDPVRVMTNRSSGKMGLALADELYAMGAEVSLVTTVPDVQRPYEVVPVETAEDMQRAIECRFEDTEILLMAAAVADFAVAKPTRRKIKKEELAKNSPNPESLTLELTQNIDILAWLGTLKQPGQVLAGFAAETEEVLANARKKLARKNIDLIIANDISRKDIGFAADENEVTILFRDPGLVPVQVPRAPKTLVAREILGQIYHKLLKKHAANDPLLYS